MSHVYGQAIRRRDVRLDKGTHKTTETKGKRVRRHTNSYIFQSPRTERASTHLLRCTKGVEFSRNFLILCIDDPESF